VGNVRFEVPSHNQNAIINRLITEAVGFGLLDTLLMDEHVVQVVIADLKHIYVKRGDQFEQAELVFDTDDQIMSILDGMVRGYSNYYLQRETLPPVLSLPWERGTVTIICPPETIAMVVIIDIGKS
jgi:pilus assembly protein CpaF